MSEGGLLAAARQALAAWDVDVAEVQLFTQSENTVFKVRDTQDVAYALRLHRPGYHTLDELHAEHVWTAALQAGGIAVPTAVMARGGAPYVWVVDPHSKQGYHVGLVRWVEGEVLAKYVGDLRQTDAVCAVYNRLGRLVGAMHEVTIAWSVPAGFQRHRWDTDGFTGEAPFWGRFWEAGNLPANRRERLERVRTSMRARLAELPTDPTRFGMVHGDLHANNVLYDRKLDLDHALTVIDFDDAGFSWFAFDLAVAIWDQQDALQGGERFADIHAALGAGYRHARGDAAEGPLADVSLFLLMRSLMLLGWLHDRPAVARPGMFDAVLEMAFAQAAGLSLD